MTAEGPRLRQDALEAHRRKLATAAQALDDLAEAYLKTFATPAGQRVLDDLEARVMVPVLPANCTEAELRDLNGMKRLFGLIMERIEHGRRRRAERAAAAARAGDAAGGRAGG